MFRSLVTAVGVLAISATAFAAQTTTPAAKPKPAASTAAPKAAKQSRAAWASGEISRFDASSKTLVVKQGASEQTFVLADNATIMDGKKKLSINDLSGDTGHNARVRFTTSGGTKTASRVELTAPKATASAAKPAAKPATKKG